MSFTRKFRNGQHSTYCRCAQCGPVDKWAVYDGDKIFTVHRLSQAEINRRKNGKQLKAGRYWLKWDDVPVEAREVYLNIGNNALATADPIDCPFCGSTATLTCGTSAQRSWHFVICANPACGCSLSHSFSPEAALVKWNRRAIRLRIVSVSQEAA